MEIICMQMVHNLSCAHAKRLHSHSVFSVLTRPCHIGDSMQTKRTGQACERTEQQQVPRNASPTVLLKASDSVERKYFSAKEAKQAGEL